MTPTATARSRADQGALAELERLRGTITDELSADDRYRLNLHAAQICLQLPGAQAHDDAVEHLFAAWRARPGDQDVLIVLSDRLRQVDRPRQLAELLEQAAEQLSDLEEQTSLLRRAIALRDELGDDAHAGRLRERLPAAADGSAEATPTDDAALEALPAEQRLDLLATRARDADTQGDRAAAWRQVAQIAEDALADIGRAATAWWKAWDCAATGEEATNLKRIFTGAERWSDYERVLRREALGAADANRKLEVYRELASFQREVLGDELAAAETYGLLLQLQPNDVDALRARVDIYTRHERHDRAMRALARLTWHAEDAERREQAAGQLAELAFAHGRYAAVTRALRRLDTAAADNRALVLRLYEAADPKQANDDAAARALRLLRDQLRSMLLSSTTAAQASAEEALRLARQCADDGSVGQAIDIYRRLLEREPDHAAATEALAALEAGLRPDETPATRLARRAADLAGDRPLQAVRLLARAAQIEAHGGADPEVVKDLLRRAIALWRPDATDELQLLETALRDAKLHWELADLLADAAEQTDDRTQRKQLLRTLAALLLEELEQPQHAVEALEQALALDGRDVPLAREVVGLHRALGNHAARAHTLELLVAIGAGQSDPELLAELGALYAEQTDERDRALQVYGELLRHRPDHRTALEFCRRHYASVGDPRSAAAILSRAAGCTEDLLQRAELHRELAQMAESQLGDLDLAITQWRKVTETLPADTAPREELKRLLAMAGRWGEVEAVLLSEVSRSIPEQKVPIYLELAEIASKAMDRPRAAAAYLRNALQLSPHNHQVLERLELAYEASEQWRELSMILRRHADAEQGVDAKVRLLHRAARVLMGHLQRDEETLAICRRIRELRPADRASATTMAQIYAKRGQWRQLAGLLGEQISRESDPAELGRLHIELGRLLLERLEDHDAAAEHFEAAMDVDTGRGEILPLLRRLYASMGRWDQLTDLIMRRANTSELSAEERAASLCEVGRIREQQQQDLEGAWKAYENAAHLAPDYGPALTALRALAVTTGRWREAVAVARRELRTIEDGVERGRLLVWVAEVLTDRLGRPGAATQALEDALEADPTQMAASERLANIYFNNDEFERAGKLLEQLVSSGVELENLHDYYFRLGYARERVGQTEQAFGYYVKSFGREPLYLPTLDRLVDLCYQRRQWDNTVRIAEAIVETYAAKKTPEQLADLYVRLGLCHLHLAQRDIAVGKLQELALGPNPVPRTPATAWEEVADSWAATPLDPHLLPGVDVAVVTTVVKAMEQALNRVPDHPGALQTLAALTICRKDYERTLRYLERALETPRADRRTRALLAVAAGDIVAHRLRTPVRAEAYYRRALELLPGLARARRRLNQLRESSASRPPGRRTSASHGPAARPPKRPAPPSLPPDSQAGRRGPGPSHGPPTIPDKRKGRPD